MIYAAKPQRGGRSIQANTNNPPQDPPPTEIPLEPTEVFIPIYEEPTIVSTVMPKIVKVSWFRRVVTKIQNIFRRK